MSSVRIAGKPRFVHTHGGGDVFISPLSGAGLTVNISFESSWSVQPSGISTVNQGTLSYPSVGFPDLATQQTFEAVINQWIGDFKKLVLSTGTINLRFGYGQFVDPSSGNSFGIHNLGIAGTHGEQEAAYNYADYIAELGNLPPQIAAFYPTFGGAFPNFGAAYDNNNRYLTSTCKAIWNNSVDTGVSVICAVVNGDSGLGGNTWDVDLNTTACGASKVKFYRLLWHECTQSMGRYEGLGTIGDHLSFFTGLAYTAPGVGFDPRSLTGTYLSIDGGVTSLGNINTTGDPFDFAAATTSGYAFNNPAGSAGIPGSPVTIPGGNTLPLRSQQDIKLTCGLYPPTLTARTLAGI